MRPMWQNLNGQEVRRGTRCRYFAMLSKMSRANGLTTNTPLKRPTLLGTHDATAPPRPDGGVRIGDREADFGISDGPQEDFRCATFGAAELRTFLPN